ncbi:hypothetical protein GQR58_020773 [Nymphon striatum]|nr:hypothetical protein GQR58_020773 [Nymphon striatum]
MYKEGLDKDQVCLIFYSYFDKVILVAKNEDCGGYWLPFKAAENPESWMTVAKSLSQQITGNEDKEIVFLGVQRVQIPFSENFSNRAYFSVRCNSSEHFPILAPKKAYLVNHDEILAWSKVENYDGLCSFEPVQFCEKAGKSYAEFNHIFKEVCLSDICQQFPISSQSIPAKRSNHEILLEAAKFGQEDQYLIYQSYLSACYPGTRMTPCSFSKFISQFSFNNSSDCIIQTACLYRAFNSQQRPYLHIKDLILGLAAMEPNIQHGGVPAELRCRYIFRYYNESSSGYLSREEFKTMLKDVRTIKGDGPIGQNIDEEIELNAKYFGHEKFQEIGLHEFLVAVGQLKFRGTSVLLRLSLPISVVLSKISAELNTLLWKALLWADFPVCKKLYDKVNGYARVAE